jgi:threonine dehydratase
MLTIEKVRQAQKYIAPYVVETPLVYSDFLSRQTSKKVYLKLESQQFTSSFKPRPAFNSILTHLEEARTQGVLISSSCNFAQAVAYASQKLNVTAEVVMMKSASAYKKARTRSFGAEIFECGNSAEERQQMIDDRLAKTERVFLHQYDTFETMAGDATVGLEILNQFPTDYAVICCTSGGGLTAGVAFITKELRPHCEVYGALPHTHFWPNQSMGLNSNVPTIADALVPAKPGTNTYPIVNHYVDGIAVITNEEIKDAMRALCFEQRLVVEPGGAAAVAGLLSGKLSKIKSPTIICVITGANIDFPDFVKFIQ